jgi:anti-sigma B factor antagonist
LRHAIATDRGGPVGARLGALDLVARRQDKHQEASMQQPEMLPIGSSQVIVVLANDPTEDTVICLDGEHDLSSVETLMQAIARAVDSGRSDLIFDLSRVEFMDSTIINQLVGACTRLGAEGRLARVRDPSPAARCVLEIGGLSHLES